MTTICAWCQVSLSDSGAASPIGRAITHGICTACGDLLLSEGDAPLHDFIETLPDPVLVAGDDVVVFAANKAAAVILAEGGVPPDGELAGAALRCVNAGRPGGCGRTAWCSGCAVRNSVTRTYVTGESCLRVPAVVTRETPGGAVPTALRVTTGRVGDKVLLLLEPVDKEPAHQVARPQVVGT